RRSLHLRPACGSPTPEGNSTTSAVSDAARTPHARGQELSPRTVRSRPGRSNLAEGRACPKPRCITPAADALNARAKNPAQQSTRDATSSRKPLLQQCREQGLTPELSRAVKRRRLE